MQTRFTKQSRQFRFNSKEDQVVQRAQEHFERTLIAIQGKLAGSVAALKSRNADTKLNYGEIFVRDNVPVMIYLLAQGRFSIVKQFLRVCLSLQSTSVQTRGVFPTSFVEEEGNLVADYGQRSIGRITSVDASLWWPILCWIYVKRIGDEDFGRSPEVQRGIQLLLDLVLHPSFEGTPVLFVPDCAFMIDRPMDVWGAPLEVEVLLYGSLRSCIELMELCQRHDTSALLAERLRLSRQWTHDLRQFLLKHYWVTSKTIQVLRRRPTEQYGDNQHQNEFNVQPQVIPDWLQDWLENRGGYLIGNIRTGRPDFRFYSLGNSLASMFGLLTAPQQRALFRLVQHNRAHLIAQMPMRICHPPMEGVEWENKTGSDPKNWPWSYHNGGHWPSLLWFFGSSVLLHEQMYPNADVLLMGQMKTLLDECYRTHLNQLPRQQWAEYFDGPTGTWVGQQSRTYQTWTIVGFLLTHHFLRVNSDDALMLNLDAGPSRSNPYKIKTTRNKKTPN
ncbi:glycoside hydrolase 100 family protein [Synechococcus sp. M16CYN]|uniref:glycoside hydrolase 100 family protein n=1 Tax=Synechococcus sp. M16CYN TaxID=3103139 RepID=UPI0032469161